MRTTLEYYSAVKKSEVRPFAEKRKEVGTMTLLGISQAQKGSHDFYHACNLKTRRRHGNRRGTVGEGGGTGEGNGVV